MQCHAELCFVSLGERVCVGKNKDMVNKHREAVLVLMELYTLLVKLSHFLCLLQVVHETMDRRPYICRCIGISGSCTVQTCQSELPEFSELGRRIRQIYDDHTCRVQWNGVLGENSRLRPDCDGDYTNRDIIYTDLSPRYCTRHLRYGSLGTLGRECDPHSSGPNSCDNLCTQCGRGHRAVTEETVENCYCEFVFCCDIRCHTCSKTRAYYVCT